MHLRSLAAALLALALSLPAEAHVMAAAGVLIGAETLPIRALREREGTARLDMQLARLDMQLAGEIAHTDEPRVRRACNFGHLRREPSDERNRLHRWPRN